MARERENRDLKIECCDTMWVLRQADNLFVLARKPKGLNSRSPARPEVEEERKVREKTGASGRRKTGRGVDIGGQRRAVGFELTIQRMRESIEVRKATAKT